MLYAFILHLILLVGNRIYTEKGRSNKDGAISV